MSIKEIAYKILNTVRGGYTVDDEPMSILQLYSHIHDYRAKIFDERFKSIVFYDENFYSYVTNLKCVLAECKDVALDCCIDDMMYGENVYVVKIPPVLRTKYFDGILSIENIGASKKFTKVHQGSLKYKKYSRFTSDDIYYSVVGSDVYFFTKNKKINYVNINLVLENPLEDKEIYNCKNKCTEDSKYPIAQSHVSSLIQLIHRDIFGIMLQTKYDDVNNASNESYSKLKMPTNERVPDNQNTQSDQVS